MTPTIYRTSAVALVLAMLAACSSGGSAESTTTVARSTTTTTTSPATTSTVPRTTTSTSTSTSTTTTTVLEVLRMPLTGEPVGSVDEIPVRPALAVKIDNHPKARPQAGLNEADIVFEEIVEGTLTRFAAVFHSQGADPVGPIRSGRTQDVDILSSLHSPLFAWSGGNRGVTNAINDSDLVSLSPSTAPGFYRRSGRGGAPHNLYSSTDALWLSAPPDFRVPDPIFPYTDPGEQVTGQPATTINVPMDGVRVEWTYDPQTGLYFRSQNGDAHQDELSGQVTTANLVVMGVEYHRSPADPRSPEAQTLGSGPLFVFSHGTMRQGVWIHLDRNDPFGFVAADDSIIELEPGRTFVELAYNAANFVTWQA